MRHEGSDQQLIPDKIEGLRRILEREQARPIVDQEAMEIGQSLIRFFEVLADNGGCQDDTGE